MSGQTGPGRAVEPKVVYEATRLHFRADMIISLHTYATEH